VEIWSVYERPADHPEGCAVQKILVEADGLLPAEWQFFRTLHEARAALARRGLIRVPRAQEDDPALLECWL
jgi:hypothetical protein